MSAGFRGKVELWVLAGVVGDIRALRIGYKVRTNRPSCRPQVSAKSHLAVSCPPPQRLANSKAHTSRFISANLPCNKFKNRLVNIMPFESTRVCLQPIRGVEGSDYINASYIDGYRYGAGVGWGEGVRWQLNENAD